MRASSTRKRYYYVLNDRRAAFFAVFFFDNPAGFNLLHVAVCIQYGEELLLLSGHHPPTPFLTRQPDSDSDSASTLKWPLFESERRPFETK